MLAAEAARMTCRRLQAATLLPLASALSSLEMTRSIVGSLSACRAVARLLACCKGMDVHVLAARIGQRSARGWLGELHKEERSGAAQQRRLSKQIGSSMSAALAL